jgi:hypothetical protein
MHTPCLHWLSGPAAEGSTTVYQSVFDSLESVLSSQDGFYISPAFLDKLSIHVAKNFMDLPKIKVPLILGIWGGKGQGKTFQVRLPIAQCRYSLSRRLQQPAQLLILRLPSICPNTGVKHSLR